MSVLGTVTVVKLKHAPQLPGGLVEIQTAGPTPEFLICLSDDLSARESVFLTSLQMMLMLLVLGHA